MWSAEAETLRLACPEPPSDHEVQTQQKKTKNLQRTKM